MSVMSGYTKLFSSIVHSTVWRGPDHMRIVWITMLAMADRDGIVEASTPGLADVARVGVEECREALEILKAPDPDSRTKTDDGRRIVEVDGGWRLLNYLKYREKMSRADQAEKNRKRVAAWRERKKSEADVRGITSVTCAQGNDKKKQKKKQKQDLIDAGASRRVSPDVRRVFEAWRQDTGHHRAKLDAKRTSRIAARLREGFSADDLIVAITHRHHDPFLMGQNDTGRIFDGIETLLRDTEQVERLRDLESPLRPKQVPVAPEVSLDGPADEAWLQRMYNR